MLENGSPQTGVNLVSKRDPEWTHIAAVTRWRLAGVSAGIFLNELRGKFSR